MEKNLRVNNKFNVGSVGIIHWSLSAILVLLHPTSGYSEIYFYFEIHFEISEIHVGGIINR